MNKGNVRIAGEPQLDELRIAVDKAVNKLRGHIDVDTAQAWIGTSGALDMVVGQLLISPIVKPEPITRLISGDYDLVLLDTTGKRTIAKAGNVFSGGIDRDFINWGLDVSGVPTGVTRIAVHEMVRDGAFKDIFADITLWFTQEQVIAFVERHANWLHPNGWATFLPFIVGKECFVACVIRYSDGRPNVYVYRSAYDHVWYAEYRYRVVVPQLTTSAT